MSFEDGSPEWELDGISNYREKGIRGQMMA